MNQAAERDRARLHQLETVVRRSFIEAGEALEEIRSKRLYRVDFRTFARYCESRWGFRRQHAYRLIAAAKHAKKTSPAGDKVVPQTERQARVMMEDETVALGPDRGSQEPSPPVPPNPVPVAVAKVTVGMLVDRIPEFETALRDVPKDRVITLLRWDGPATRSRTRASANGHTPKMPPTVPTPTPARLTRDIPVPWSADVLHEGAIVTVTREHMPTHPGKYVHRYFEIVSEGRVVVVRDTDLDARRGRKLPPLVRAPKAAAIGKLSPRSSDDQRRRWVPIIPDGAVAPTLTNYGKDWNDDPGRDGAALVVEVASDAEEGAS